ncbi:hypothetical protein KP509_14G062500 [Ceratopteris richardii]|uniref:Pectinesterase n=1 Tax=Ceratopteris richardii TaxID=49495 RepID=A0A8T2TFM0_CERRI|nr:hypothetical protein KP509_14G062500 [Ceratopteris richardii]
MKRPHATTHLLLFVAAALYLFSSPIKVKCSLSTIKDDDDFGNWVQRIQDTCKVEPNEDNSDGYHLPDHPVAYDDHNVDNQVRELAMAEKQAISPNRKLGEVSKNRERMIVVAKDGSGDVETVQAAIDLVPKANKERIIIYVKRGIYSEKLVFPKSKPFITLKGEGSRLTFLQWGDIASDIGEDGDRLGTSASASVAVESDHFIALDISFKNTAPAPEGGEVGKQGVALRVQGDKAAFYRCRFYGAQDTLYDKAGRHYYYRCYIEGSIDFIFGNARSLYVECHIHSIATPWGAITAQKRIVPEVNTGFSFVYCVVTGSGEIYLGRAWGPYSRVVFAHTYFDDIIRPEAWNDFGIEANQKRVIYGEYRCFGPGADRTGRVPWSRTLGKGQALPFLSIGFVDGHDWIAKR